MSKKANPTAVGLFVCGAIFLGVMVIVMVGTEGMFDRKETFVAYFKTNANGLNEGSDVKIGGVKVGTVKKIHIMSDPVTREKLIPVTLQLSAEKIASATGDRSAADVFRDGSFEEAIADGLTASMKKESLLTGLLYIDLDLLPDAEAFTYGGETVAGLEELVQIPTVGLGLDRAVQSVAQVLENINRTDFEGISIQLKNLLNDIDEAVVGLETKKISDSTVGLLEDARTVVNDAKLKSAIAKLDSALGELEGIATTLNGKMGPIADNLDGTLANAATAMEKAREAAAGIAAILQPEAPLVVRVNRTFGELEQTARSIRQLSDFLRQNPNALLTGKKRPR